MTRTQVLDVFGAEVGYTESPPNSNDCKYNTAFYGREVWDGLWNTTFPWCAVLIWWGFMIAGMSDQIYGGYKTASCPTLAEWFKSEGKFVTSGYRAGDIVFFDFGVGGYGYDHVGIIESVNDDGTYTCIEGNTSFDNSGSQSNGGAVARRTRTLLTISGAGRIDYDPEEEIEVRYNVIADMPIWAQPTIMKLCDNNYLRGQGGPKDENGRPGDLDLSIDMIRVLVILDRAGEFDD